MKAHTQTFKENLITLGKEIDAKVTYTIDGVETELDGDTLGSVTPHYEGSILKSVMKQVDIVSDIDIPLNTEINVQFGMRYDTDEYEYIDYGNYIVFSSQKQEDTNKYKIVAYDKMLYAMKDYEELEITYPITIRDYISAICTKLDLEFANANDMFANYDKEIKQELYANLGYTFRDVLDEIAQVTASTICINKDDELEVRYLNENANETQEVEGTNLTLSDSESARISGVEIEGETTQETTTGKSLLDFSNLSVGNVTYTYTNEVLSVVGSAATYTRAYYDLTSLIKNNPGKVLRFDHDGYTTSVSGIAQVQLQIKRSGSSDAYPALVTSSGVSNNYTIPSDTSNITQVLIRILPNNTSTAQANTITFTRPMLHFGTTRGDYEPFTNGPSPNPDFPQQINTITGLQEIDIRGKNLANPNDFTFAIPTNVSISYDSENNEMTATTLETKTNNDLFFRTKIADELLQNGETYTISNVNVEGAYQNLKLQLRNKNGSMASGKTQASSVVYDNNYSLYIVGNPFASSNVSVPSGSVCKIKNIQVEKGSSSSSYEPYKNKVYEINLGKNLFNFAYTSGTTSGITTTIEGTNLKITNTATGTSRNITGELPPFEKGTYTFSVDQTSPIRLIFRTYDNNGTKNSFALGFSVKSVQVTFDGTETKWRLIANPVSGTTYDVDINLQFEKGPVATSYSNYFTPIELGKISDYKDFIRKGKGINLFDNTKSPTISTDTTISTGKKITHNGSTTTNAIFVIYAIMDLTNYVGKTIRFYADFVASASNKGRFYIGLCDSTGNNRTQLSLRTTSGVASFVVPELSGNQTYLCLVLYANHGGTINSGDYVNYTNMILTIDNEDMTYEPYKFKDKWYLHKEIGKVVLNGSENWSVSGTGTNNWFFQANNVINANYIESVRSQNKCNRYIYTSVYSTNTNQGIWYGSTYLRIRYGTEDTIANYKTWLSSNNVIANYILAAPTITEITNNNYPELLSQLKALDNAKTYEGVTNILSTFPIKFSYATEYETIDEDYIKNTRADFGEKYGPINSIVLSRSADSDNIYIKDQDSIDENGLCEVKIKDNQIMNDNDRSDFLPDLLEYLKYIEFYINDFESIGITYLDLCDKYKVKIDDKKYDCVMFDDEVEIHDGLNEIIYTNKPKQNVTDYKKASTTDKQERQTYLMVDKQAQRIDALISDEDENFSRIQVEIDNISSQVQSTNVELDSLGEEIEVVRSSITEQTSEAITDWFNTALKPTIEDLENSVDSNDQTLNEIKSYVRRGVITDPQSPYYNQAFVELGDTTNQTTLRILPNRIQFLTNGQETAFISNNQLYINESTILTKEKIGNWVTTQDENGLLNTYWED